MNPPKSAEPIFPHISVVRDAYVMLDSDLAALYGVITKRLNEKVRRNRGQFPEDFMFQLTDVEAAALRSQIATLKTVGRGQHRKYQPWVFTEHGAIMAATVLNSERAVAMSVFIVRAGACPERSRMGEDAGGVAGGCDAGGAVTGDREDAARPRQRVARCDPEVAPAAAAAAGPAEAADRFSQG